MSPDELHGNMKKNQNGSLFHINSPERYADPPATTEINDKDGYWNTPELECAMGMDDFTNVNGNELERSHPQLDSEFFEKETDLYTDKNVTECELPELMICYKESGAYHVVKDICVDEGIHSEEKNLTENCENAHEALSVSSLVKEDKCDDIVKESLETQSFMHSSLSKDAANECGTQENFDSALLTQDSHNGISSSLPKSDISDLARKGDHTEPLNLDGLELEYGDEEKGQGHNGPILDDHEDDHGDLSEKSTDTKSLLVDGPQSLMVKDCNAIDEFGTKLVANFELPIAKGIQESSDDSDVIAFSECGPALNTDQGATDDCGPLDLVQSLQTVEDIVPAIGKLTCDASAEESDSNSMSSAKTYLPQTSLKFLLNSSEFGTDDDEQQPHQIPVEEISKSPDSSSDAEEVSSSDQSPNLTVNSEVEGGNIGLNLDTEKAAAISAEETSGLPIKDGNLDSLTKASQEQYGVGETSFSVVGPIEGLPTYVGPNHEDGISDTASLARLVRDDGESSFFMEGPVSGRIAYSGQIPFSGSISLRSESSTTSTRSFAFPVDRVDITMMSSNHENRWITSGTGCGIQIDYRTNGTVVQCEWRKLKGDGSISIEDGSMAFFAVDSKQFRFIYTHHKIHY